MKDKNGYTLTEVLAVITIIALISILTVSISVRVLDQGKKKISEYDKTILVDAGITFAEDIDKNDIPYKMTETLTINDKTFNQDSEIKGYDFKIVANNKKTLPVSTEYLYEHKYLGQSYEKCVTDDHNVTTCSLKEEYKNCTINMQFETSIQDGYIVIDKINANLGEDCK